MTAGTLPLADAGSGGLDRRRSYRPSLLRGDYFVVRHLDAFLDRSIRRWTHPGATVADVGCGEQPLRALVERLGAVYTGIDVHQNRQGTVDVIADITAVPLPDAAFDVILCTEVLEHVPDTHTAVAELARLCRPGGMVLVTTPFAYPLHEEPSDFIRVTPYLVRESARRAGLEVVELGTTGNELEVLATVWCNLWSRLAGGGGPLRSVWNVLMRLPVNLAAAAGSGLLGSILPRKYFLSTVAALRRPI